MNNRVPIVWLNSEGVAPKGQAEIAHPFIEVQLTRDTDDTNAKWLQTLALVDTGLTFSLVHPLILEAIGAKANGTRELAGNSGMTTSGIYATRWSVSATPQCIVADHSSVLEHDLPFLGAKAIVGMSFLQFGTLHLRGPHDDSFFEFHMDRMSR